MNGFRQNYDVRRYHPQNLYRIQQPIGRPSFWGKEFRPLAPSVSSFRVPNRKKTPERRRPWNGPVFWGDPVIRWFPVFAVVPYDFHRWDLSWLSKRWVSVERLRLLHGTAEKTKYEETNPFRGTWAPIFSRILSWLGDTHNSEDWIEISEDWNFKILTTRMVLGFFKGDMYRLVHLGTVILVHILFTICLCFFRWYECH